jgi:putative NADH-flavin reductase
MEVTMHIALFGATGGTGRQIVAQSLAAGHTITALVRDPAKLSESDPRLTLVVGDVLDSTVVAKTVQGADVVVVTLGNSPNNPERVVSNGTANIVAEMQRQSLRRIVVITSLGVGDSKDQVPFFFRMLMQTALRAAMKDKEAQEEIIRNSGLDWTIIRPGGLTDGPRTDAYTAGVDATIQASQVSRADVAAFVVQQYADSQYIHATPAIT